MTLLRNSLVATFALVANGFMIPPTVSMPEMKGDGLDLLVTPPAPEQTSRIIKLDCSNCPSSNQIDESSIVLNFKTSEDRDSLLINEHVFFPVPDHTFRHTALQVSSDVSIDELRANGEEVIHSTQPLSYSAAFQSIPAADGADAALTDIDLFITHVGNQALPLGPLHIRILQDEQGRITIADIVRGSDSDATEVDEDLSLPQTPDKPNGDDEELMFIQPIGELGQGNAGKEDAPEISQGTSCPNHVPPMICRLRMAILAKIEALRASKPTGRHPCPGMLRAMNKKPKIHGGVPKFIGQVEQHGHQWHHHHHHSKAHRVLHTIRRVLVGFLIPVMIGIAAGMTASLLGMVVGTVIAWVWIKVVRGGKRGGASERVDLREAAVEEEASDEKQGLLTYVDAAEEDLPPYVEKE